MEDTIFGKITRGEIPTDFLYQDEQCVVIKDIYPQAPTHVLIIPRKPIPMLSMADEEDQALLGHLLVVAGKVAFNMGVEFSFVLVFFKVVMTVLIACNNVHLAGAAVFGYQIK